ncbi:sulfite exporter TauE/SafE family protein [Pseudoalteromonas sp. SSDWG2]|uniref:sulfite exporter TauE/SafE family protein n=1 Tax=Pseudoalteromonas sp. SSDWG2 TaxID=3139391 RepID=UPI003BAD2C26
MSLTTLAVIACVVFLTGISKSGFAGALGVFAVPLLLLVMPAIDAIALMLPILIIADIFSLKSYWRQWRSDLVRLLMPGIFIGVIIAQWFISVISPTALTALVASFSLLFALRSLFFSQARSALLATDWGARAMATISGVASTLVHAGGPPLIIYFSSKQLKPLHYVATAAVLFAFMNAIKLIAFTAQGFLTGDILITALAFTPIAFMGNWVGVKIQQRFKTQKFLKAMNWLLVMLAITLFIKLFVAS